ncbi:hypothetical protein M404DRAFT_32459 [Pisolithus tinctorius Marx 270]|uniref:Uncharacterized protein n=1 Tax=Pisolithus tinctorius Marx 270 TaxID=870435 RepID=A0A0C3IJT3_PISTI|nr:hypothetical protein M404DRAFT_32459 [Pisolithus tinctorius Marx 270]
MHKQPVFSGPFGKLTTTGRKQSGQHAKPRKHAEHRKQRSAPLKNGLNYNAVRARKKKRKKYKAKFTPIRNIKAPTGPVNIPAPYASRKLLKGEYCELYFFTNAGLAEAESFNPSVDDEALTLLKTDSGQHLWVPASATRDKASVIKDEDLTWEQFGEAALRMVEAMRNHDWPEESVQMHIDFWTALESHPWRRSPREHYKRALLLYQSQQRQRWHRSNLGSYRWSLAELNEELLNTAKDEILDNERTKQLENLRKNRSSSSPLPKREPA